MTPMRFMVHIRVMTGDETVETAVTIKSMISKYKVAASADKEYDIEWYCDQLIKVIDQLTVNGWPGPQVKQQLRGRLSSIIPAEIA